MAKTKNNQASGKHQQRSPESKQQSSAQSQSSRTDIARREDLARESASPVTFMRRFSEEMDRLLENFGFGARRLAPTFESGLDRFSALGSDMWAPQVEVFERDNQLIVRTDLPGMTKDDVNVEITDDALVIRGERKSEREENEEGYYRSERSYGSFYRRIPLPEGTKAEEAKADFRDGVLEIKMPVAERAEQKRRQIEIRGATESAEQSRSKARAAGQK